MHSDTKFGIPSSKNIGDMHQTQCKFSKLGQRSRSQWPKGGTRHSAIKSPTSNNMRYAPDTVILKTRSEVKVTVTWKWYATLRHPKDHLHTKFGNLISKNIGDMHRTRRGMHRLTVHLLYASKSTFGGIKNLLPTMLLVSQVINRTCATIWIAFKRQHLPDRPLDKCVHLTDL